MEAERPGVTPCKKLHCPEDRFPRRMPAGDEDKVQQRTILGLSIPRVALRLSTTSWASRTMRR